MYFYLRDHVTKINVIKANLNVIQNFFILLFIYEKLPLRTRGTSISVPEVSRKLATGMEKF